MSLIVLVRSTVAASCIGLACAANAEENNRVDVLSPDLAFRFMCQERNKILVSNKISQFLGQSGFRVLDIVRVAREQKVAYGYVANIVALDDKRRTVKVMAFPIGPDVFYISLSSPPPTRHDASLEDRLTTFVAKDLGCEVKDVSRNENTAAPSAMYEELYERAESWFKQAERMGRPKSQ